MSFGEPLPAEPLSPEALRASFGITEKSGDVFKEKPEDEADAKDAVGAMRSADLKEEDERRENELPSPFRSY